MIKFGISRNYIPDWTIVSAIREIFQNYIDFGEYDVVKNDVGDGKVRITISNKYEPDSLEFLKIGFTNKSSANIGGHGEGLKLAGMIFHRQELDFVVRSKLCSLKPVWYDDSDIGECYGLEKEPPEVMSGFTVSFIASKDDVAVFDNSRVETEDIVFKTGYGSIVNKPVVISM